MNKTSWLYLLCEFGPLLAFFIAGQVTSFFNAVGVLMLTTSLAVLASWKLVKHIPWLPIISAVFVLGGGAVTLLYKSPDAIIFADTLYYILLSLGFGYTLLRKRLVLKSLFSEAVAISDEGWYALTWRWLLLLVLAAIANEIARYTFSPDQWIDYRFYKTMIITVFALSQFLFIKKHRLPGVSNYWGLRKD